MSDSARIFNVGTPIEFEGRVYEIGELTYEEQGQFAARHEQLVWEGVKRSRRFLDDDSYNAAIAAVTRDIGNQRYEFMSKDSLEFTQTPTGMKYLLYLLLKAKDKTVNMALVDRLFEAKMAEIIELLNRVNAPDPQTGAGTQAGNSSPSAT